jgi:hypothetical protein
MYKNRTSRCKTFFDETSGRWEVLKQVLVFDIIDFNDHMLVAFEQLLFERKSQHR